MSDKSTDELLDDVAGSVDRIKVLSEARTIIAELQAENARLKEALIGFQKFCIKPECACWACVVLAEIRGEK